MKFLLASILAFGLLFNSSVKAGHYENTPRQFVPELACLNENVVKHIIELSAINDEAVREFWQRMVIGQQCKYFPLGLTFWIDEIVAKLKWGDGEDMYIIQGHDNQEVEVYIWMPVAQANNYNLPPFGMSKESLND